MQRIYGVRTDLLKKYQPKNTINNTEVGLNMNLIVGMHQQLDQVWHWYVPRIPDSYQNALSYNFFVLWITGKFCT